jgi:hypothetical protein
VAERREVRRRAVSSAAGKPATELPDIAHDTIMSARVGGLCNCENRADQKIVHLRIVLKARFA